MSVVLTDIRSAISWAWIFDSCNEGKRESMEYAMRHQERLAQPLLKPTEGVILRFVKTKVLTTFSSGLHT